MDDEPTLRRTLARLLTSHGHIVKTAEDGEDALRQMVSTSFDVVVTDLMMPKVGGLELLDAVRRDYPTVPVIMITAFGDVEIAVKAVRAGAYHFLTKPFRSDNEVVDAVMRAAERSRRTSDHSELAPADDAQLAGTPQALVFSPDSVRILRSVAHDLVSAIAIISDLSNLILDANDGSNSSIASDTSTLRKTAEYCRMLVENLRQLYTTPMVEGMRLSVVDISAAVKDVLALLSPKIASNVVVELNLPNRIGVMADATGLRQVLFNLVKNALEAMRDGGRLSIDVFPNGRQVSAVVSDTGTGIEDDHSGKIFELHFTTKRKQGGTGTGLYLSKSITTQMGGTLSFKSDPGSGATFSLSLRAAPTEADRDNG